jgi:hypothetical protein
MPTLSPRRKGVRKRGRMKKEQQYNRILQMDVLILDAFSESKKVRINAGHPFQDDTVRLKL